MISRPADEHREPAVGKLSGAYGCCDTRCLDKTAYMPRSTPASPPRPLGRSFPCSIRRIFAATLLIAAATALAGPTATAAAKAAKVPKVKTPTSGQTCTTLGSRAPGTSLDCVLVGAKKQWQPKGSKLNPFRIGESFEWTQSSNGTNPGALISTRRLVVSEFLPDASGWVSQWSDNAPKDIFDAAKDVQVRGVRATYTLVSATDRSSRNLGSLTTMWIGDDRDAGCCTQGLLQWGTPPAEALDAYTLLDDGASRTGVMLFAQTTEKLGKRPLMRLAWLDSRTSKNQSVFFDLLPKG